ncbi:MAG: asparagine synthase (glutamine-hydrolyzing) [Desulfovibrionaceae bacterium CG1_02_65_16]|nr:MAG: asparagine synthase (glutamine-hydrolyzing) [Desulfovibrionaceae bacterium CG1_02_65_16]
MCGICGIYAPGRPEGAEVLAPLAGMTAALAHRGPDDAGVWTDAEAGIGLGHRRLSILDLSPLGRQPMFSASGRFVLSYNGEAFNHARLRQELAEAGRRFKGGSDTEVLLAAIEEWGLTRALTRCVGMFALALWDRRERVLSLARDRLGVKPLYYGHLTGGGVLFASELKALRRHACFDAALDRDALTLYFRHNYIPAPHSIYAQAKKLLPGEILVIDAKGERRERYWDVEAVWREGFEEPLTSDDDEATDALERLLTDAVGLRMLADVPVGALLSGGIDSSLVTALMQKQSTRPVRTFSIGFAEAAWNEAPHAAAVARRLGCQHTELIVSARDLLDIVPDMPRLWDEPFADSSQIPTAILCRLARRHVTVALSGDGGDELFSGYARYPWTLRAHALLSAIPAPLRGAAHALLRALPTALWGLLPRGHKLRWRLDALGAADFEALYRHFVSHLKDPAALIPGAREPQYAAALLRPMGDTPDARRAWMSLADILNYLPDDILTKVDRASMAVGLEARTPLLDHRVAEFAARTPMSRKVRGGQSKWLLRQVLRRHVPESLTDRPKMGFGVPIAAWLKGELRPWASDLLSPAAVRAGGLLDADMVARMWREYLAGEDNWCHCLWDVLMFQAWREADESGDAASRSKPVDITACDMTVRNMTGGLA